MRWSPSSQAWRARHPGLAGSSPAALACGSTSRASAPSDIASVAANLWFKLGFVPVSLTEGFNAVLICETNDANSGGATAVATYNASFQTAITYLKANGAELVIQSAVPTNGCEFTNYTEAPLRTGRRQRHATDRPAGLVGRYSAMNGYGVMCDGLHPNASVYAVARTGMTAHAL